MQQTTKYWIAAAAGALIVAAAGGGWWWHHGHNSRQAGRQISSQAGQSTPPDTGGLQVNGGSASNLGQLGGNQAQSGGGQTGGSSDLVNPAQLAQYDKYKDAQHALFGDIKAGDGADLTAGKTAAVYYKGWLTSGQLFDQTKTNSDGSQQPFIFTLGAHTVIPGFEEAVYGMKVGGTRLLIIPPAAGYGAQGQGPVPPNAVLIFEIQLLQVQ
jgi:FKBP-type peptidyl-prolyl cis-trans isomerase FkpA